MKILLIVFFNFLNVNLFAQIDTLFVQIDGMTCSLCSRSVEDQLMKQSSVLKVIPQLNSQEMIVLINVDSIFTFESIGNAVFNAGFSVGKIRFKNCTTFHPLCQFKYQEIESNLNNTQYYLLLKKGLVSKKILKKYESQLTTTNTYFVINE
jgi:copper chaperone CopZ